VESSRERRSLAGSAGGRSHGEPCSDQMGTDVSRCARSPRQAGAGSNQHLSPCAIDSLASQRGGWREPVYRACYPLRGQMPADYLHQTRLQYLSALDVLESGRPLANLLRGIRRSKVIVRDIKPAIDAPLLASPLCLTLASLGCSDPARWSRV
jgi:hypothetical protein